MRFKKIVKRIKYNTTIVYHGKSRMNQGNSSITTEYHNNEKFNLDNLVERVNKCAKAIKIFVHF